MKEDNMPRRPDTEAYVKALTEIEHKITPLQRRMLIAHYELPGHAGSAREIGAKAGKKSWNVVNSHYGRLGTMVREAMNYWGEGQQSHSLANFFAPNTRGNKEWLWEMFPELARALEQLEWVDPLEPRRDTIEDEEATPADDMALDEAAEDFRSPDEVTPEEELIEGASKTIIVNGFERNAKARLQCIEFYGAVCKICDFDFGNQFGPEAEGYIHVHHLVPLASRRAEYVIDPIADLRPVCPNCHAMLHLGGECRTIEEVAALLKR